MRYRFVTLATLLAVTLAIGFATASTVQKLSLERLVDEADIIVQGRVEELKTRPAPDGSSANTRVAITVAEQFKGKKLSSVTIEQPGGSLGNGNVVQGAPGTPTFSPGEHVIVFLQRRTNDTYRIVGGTQGKFTAKTDLGNDRKVIEDFAHRVESYDNFRDRLVKTIKRGP